MAAAWSLLNLGAQHNFEQLEEKCRSQASSPLNLQSHDLGHRLLQLCASLAHTSQHAKYCNSPQSLRVSFGGERRPTKARHALALVHKAREGAHQQEAQTQNLGKFTPVSTQLPTTLSQRVSFHFPLLPTLFPVRLPSSFFTFHTRISSPLLQRHLMPSLHSTFQATLHSIPSQLATPVFVRFSLHSPLHYHPTFHCNFHSLQFTLRVTRNSTLHCTLTRPLRTPPFPESRQLRRWRLRPSPFSNENSGPEQPCDWWHVRHATFYEHRAWRCPYHSHTRVVNSASE